MNRHTIPAEKRETARRMLLSGSTTTEVFWATRISDNEIDKLATELIRTGQMAPRKGGRRRSGRKAL